MEHLIHFLKDLKQTGAIAPSSKFLVKDLIEQLRNDISVKPCCPLNILEIGAGTGPLTKELVRLVRPEDHLDVVEIHDHFFQVISDKFSNRNTQIHHRDILNFEPGRVYDYIFSSLPYEAMPRELTEAIWKKKLELCSDKAYICYFKYVSFRKFKCNFEEKIVRRYQRDKKIVLLNLPPAKLYTLEIDDTASGPFWIEHVA